MYCWLFLGDLTYSGLLDLLGPVTCAYRRFCLGTINTQVELGRWQNRQPRRLEVCQRCYMHALDDETTWCLSILLWSIQAAIKHLINASVGEIMQAFMTQEDQHAVLWFVMHALRYVSRHTSG